MLTLAEAAQKLGVTAATLRQQIHAGHLKARKIGPMWTIQERVLAAYRLHNAGRIGRPFVGRPGFVDTQHVRVRLYLAPADGRGHDAIWLQYLRENYVVDLDLTNASRFYPTKRTYEHLDLLADTPPGGRTFEFWNAQQLSRELGGSLVVDDLIQRDPTFPPPVVTFRDGPIWEAAQVERWLAHRAPAP